VGRDFSSVGVVVESLSYRVAHDVRQLWHKYLDVPATPGVVVARAYWCALILAESGCKVGEQHSGAVGFLYAVGPFHSWYAAAKERCYP
jgi:hypothetical protein